ncbi:transglutaminase-like domain-containing protein, partial [Dietzia cinnamea]|nr:transglutaminase-like domain-containing protein [Dietzia cinnamea]
MPSSSIFTESILRKGSLEVTVRHFPATNYALAHNAIPVIHEVEAINRSSSERTSRVTVVATLVSVDGRELAAGTTIDIPAVEPRTRFFSPDRGLMRPHLAEIVGRTESYPADLELRLDGDPDVGVDTISADDLAEEADLTGREVDLTEVIVVRPQFRILAENEWFNAPAFFESLSAFVQPNTPEVRKILAGASQMLQERTGDSSLQGYQAGAKRAATIALAIYEALKAEGIRYINPPASFENTGQRIRSTSEVLTSRFGTCIDLAVTYSAVCEAAGLHPVVAMVEGHALTGIMLAEQSLAGPVLLEAGAIRNLVTSDVLLPLDAVFYEDISFAEASARGREILS